MSTRAIVGIMNPNNGRIIGGWQWNDGGNLGTQLRNNFKTVEDVKLLIEQGVWSILLTPRDSNLKTCVKLCTERPQENALVPVKRCHVLKKPHHVVRSFVGDSGIKVVGNHLEFETLADAFGQDINYVYLFNPNTKKWKTIGNTYSYKYIEDFCRNTPRNKHITIFDK